METIIIILLLVIIAEITYLLLKNNKKVVSRKGQPQSLIFVDTSVLIDGRIISVAKSGFITDTLAIPRSVIGELQLLADNSDGEKRSRARHGLDIVTELQAMNEVNVDIFPDSNRAEEGVDDRLLKLVKEHGGAICTIDYNLNKVAQVEQIKVLNINDLAMNLRMSYLPGERTSLALIQKGQDSHQAVGHLPDGTMVVVENASKDIGKTIEVEFLRSLQTAAGKMMFAKKIEKTEKSTPRKSPRQSPPKKANNSNNHKNNQNNQRKRSAAKRESDLVDLFNKS